MNKIEIECSWYENLVSDLILLEQTGIVATKHAIGKRILEDFEKFGQPEYGQKRIANIAKDCGMSKRELYYCVQFAEAYPELCDTAAQTSWRKICKEVLPQHKEVTDVEPIEIEMPGGTYNLIYADPPWQYEFSETTSREIESHYRTMTVEDICNMGLPKIHDDSLLLMWATAPKIIEAFEVIDAWGFQYKTSLVWDKQIMGMGYWARGQHELLMVATKGCFSPPEPAYRIPSVYSERRGKHSAKPTFFYEWIEQAFPKTKKIELFARSKRNGWTSFGNEV